MSSAGPSVLCHRQFTNISMGRSNLSNAETADSPSEATKTSPTRAAKAAASPRENGASPTVSRIVGQEKQPSGTGEGRKPVILTPDSEVSGSRERQERAEQ